MLYRLNRTFNVSKTRAAVVAILCSVAGVGLLVLFPTLPPCGVTLFAYSFIYGCIWFFKFNRDQQIVEQAAREILPQQVTSAVARPRGDLTGQPSTGNVPAGREQAVDFTRETASPGSGRLFAPPPLDRPNKPLYYEN